MSTVKKNFIYNIIYQLLILILPLITVPYVSRVLGSGGVGVYSYTYSIVSYFSLVCLLGINNYGNRTIAKCKSKKEISINFWSIYSIQIFMTLLMTICYLIYIFTFENSYKMIAIIQIIYIISEMFNINWFFFGLEKFKITISRNIILKILSFILIFIFVKNENDVWKYTLILSMSTLISQIAIFPFLKKEINFEKITFSDIKKHIKPCLILFIPVIAVSLYKTMDKIMLGYLTNVNEVGFYEQAEKIINIPIAIITALGTVMLPRISNLVSKGDNEKVKYYIKKSLNFMMFLAFPICFGLIAISSDFVPLFLGNDFIKSSVLIYYLSFTIIFISFANVIRTEYLIPNEKDKIFVVSVIGGAIINLIVNYLLIPRYLSVGACIGTIIAEFFVMMYQVITIRKELPIFDYLKSISRFFITSLLMFIVVIMIKLLNLNSFITLIIQVVLGSLMYFILNIKYISSIINFKKIKKIFNKNKL